MRSFVAFVLVSALAISASAFSPLVAADEFFDGLTTGFNYSELNPDFLACKLATNDVTISTNELIVALQARNTQAVAKAIQVLGANLSSTVTICSEAVNLAELLFESIESSILSMDQDTLVSHVFSNLTNFEADLAALRTDFENQDFFSLGESLAQIVNLVLYGAQGHPTRVIRQLEQSNVSINITTVLNVIFTIQGFIESANTTLTTDSYLTCFNDFAMLATELPTIEQALATQNISAIAGNLSQILAQLSVVAGSCGIFKNEIVAWVDRDLPYFENSTRLEIGVAALTSNLPETLTQIAEIIRQEQAQEFDLFGQAIGNLYNEFYAALSADL